MIWVLLELLITDKYEKEYDTPTAGSSKFKILTYFKQIG